MNITIVCSGFIKSSIRLQPWRRIYEISHRLAANGINVTILSDSFSNESRERIDGVTVNRISNLMLAPILGKKRITRALLANKPDIVVWCGSPLSAVYLSQFASLGKPLIWDIDRELNGLEFLMSVSFREMFHPHHRFLWQQLATAFLPRLLIRAVANSAFVAGLVVPSNSLRVSLSKIGIESDKISVIPSAIEKGYCDHYNNYGELEKSRNDSVFSPNDFTVAYFGSPCKLRGADTAILSMQKILMKRQGIKLVIFSRRYLGGSSPNEKYLQAEERSLAELVDKMGLKGNVKVLPGMLEKSRLKECYSASDAIVLPFKILLSEPPLAALEAMSMGKVVVTTNIGSLKEIIGNDRGVLIKPRDVEALAKAILFLANHPEEIAQIGKNARRYAENFPDWEYVAKLFGDMLSEIHASQSEYS